MQNYQLSFLMIDAFFFILISGQFYYISVLMPTKTSKLTLIHLLNNGYHKEIYVWITF